MPHLHMSKVAVSCASVETLKRRLEKRAEGGVVPLVTRFMPKRAEELVGGSLYWIVRHRLIARNPILRLATGEDDGGTSARVGRANEAAWPWSEALCEVAPQRTCETQGPLSTQAGVPPTVTVPRP